MSQPLPLLLQPEALAALGADDTLRVLDSTVHLEPAKSGFRAISGLDRYREGHIPGAAFMDLIRDFSDTSSGLGFTLPRPEVLAGALGRLGIARDHRVVVYSAGHMMWATRAFWLLRYAGHDAVSVLDGGLHGWRAGDREVASGDEHYPPATFEAAPRASLFADRAATEEAIGDAEVLTVNALSPEVYAGTSDHHYGRRGHIPGSHNLHYDRLLDGHFFRPSEALRAELDDAGLLAAERVITYCGGGISATLDAFACLLVGQENVAVYDGSMSEWARDPALPLRLGSSP